MVLVLKTPKANAEVARKALKELDLFDPDRSIDRNGDVRFPLRPLGERELVELSRRLGSEGVPFEVLHDDGPRPKRGRRVTPSKLVRANLGDILSPSMLEEIPTKYEKVGDVLVLVIPPSLEGVKYELGDAYREVLGVRYVLRDVGGVCGELRTPRMEVLVPPKEGGFTTVHRENGVLYVLDPRFQMLSSGNVSERARAKRYLGSGQTAPRERASLGTKVPFDGEVVYDMFAGVGYFTLPLALGPPLKRILAVEKGIGAFRHLVAGISLNSVQHSVAPILGDCRRSLPDSGADRLIMGYVGGTIGYFERALSLISPYGAVIHLHDTVGTEVGPGGLFNKARELALSAGVELTLCSSRRVKSFAPCIDHVVLDMLARPLDGS